MNTDKVRISHSLDHFDGDYSIRITISQGVLLTPMSRCATPLFDFFRHFSYEEPNFPQSQVNCPSESLVKMSKDIEKDPSNSWKTLRPVWNNGQWTAWICCGVISLHVPIDTIRSLLNEYEKLSLPTSESLKASA